MGGGLLEAGMDPSARRKEKNGADALAAKGTFGVVAAEVLANRQASKAATSTMSKNRWLLERFAAPLASRPSAEITAEILELLRTVEQRGRTRMDEGGVATGLSEAIRHARHDSLLRSRNVAEIVRKAPKQRRFR